VQHHVVVRERGLEQQLVTLLAAEGEAGQADRAAVGELVLVRQLEQAAGRDRDHRQERARRVTQCQRVDHAAGQRGERLVEVLRVQVDGVAERDRAVGHAAQEVLDAGGGEGHLHVAPAGEDRQAAAARGLDGHVVAERPEL
jgi:hypothetical protein